MYEGAEVHLAFAQPAQAGDTIRVSIIESTPAPVQGMRVIAKNCELQAMGQRAKQFVLWADTAPEFTDITPVKVKPGAEVRLMNVWRDEKYGSTLHGLNYSGIQLDSRPNGSVMLRCSDGWGPPDFSDLVVVVTRPEHSK